MQQEKKLLYIEPIDMYSDRTQKLSKKIISSNIRSKTYPLTEIS